MSLWVLFVLITGSTVLAFLYELYELLGSFWVVAALLPDILEGRVDAMEGRVTTSSTNRSLHEVDQSAPGELRSLPGAAALRWLTPRTRLLQSIEPTKIRRPDRMVH